MSTIYTVFKDTKREFTGSITKICKHFDIDRKTFSYQLLKYNDPDLTINYCISNKKDIFTVFKGTEREFTGTKTQICECFDIAFTSFSRQLDKGLSPDDAIMYCISNKKQTDFFTVFQGTESEYSGSAPQICEHFGISYSVFSRQLKKGLTPDDAVEYCLNLRKKN